MHKLSFRGLTLWRADYAGVVVAAEGSTLCIDVLRPTCAHVLYTHPHPRHYGGYGGEFLAPFNGRAKPGDSLRLGPFSVRVLPAYNVTKLEGGAPIHRGGVGYLVEAGGASVYHPGDTDLIKEMGEAAGADIFLAPIGGDGVMTPEEAVEAVKLLRPKIAVPLHFPNAALFYKFRDMAQPYTQVVLLQEVPP
ncbi:MBL fold metallo-hydrolase [Thermoproteus tenax]|uniref:MBL fold metallo-hydrolase n=1 Tax=Thermoproteus tenax TaxID=2271 RepID=UPI0006998163|nr:MBL fold metallo-hydrolase [Thermoproteus tenax]